MAEVTRWQSWSTGGLEIMIEIVLKVVVTVRVVVYVSCGAEAGRPSIKIRPILSMCARS